MSKGKLFVISGASGVGKSTVLSKVMAARDDLLFSVSATTRAPRPGETEAVSYYFVSKAQFQDMIAQGEFLEYDAHMDNYYGTPKKEVEENLNAGRNVILEIEVEGAMQIKKKCPDALLVMIAPPDFETLEARLRGRGDAVSEDVIQKRLSTAKKELKKLGEYDYIVVNGDNMVDEAAHEIIGIVYAETHRVSRNEDFANKFFA